MPRYNCECQKCDAIYEVGVPIEKLDEFDKQNKKKHRCPECDGKMKRLMGAPAFRIN